MNQIMRGGVFAGLFIAVVFSQVPASAASLDLVAGTRVVRVIPIDDVPSYFFKVSDDSKYVVYTLFKNNVQTGEQNQMLRIDGHGSGSPFDIPGNFDPMFNHDSRTMTIPVQDGSDYECGFYSESDVRRNGRAAGAKLIDTEMRCVYQSVGLLSDSPEKSTFRLIVENSNGFAMRDYEENKTTGHIRAIRPVTPLCPGFNIKLPMISKNGHEMGAYSEVRHTSVILKVEDDGRCEVEDDLKVRAGKIAFSYDGNKVAYHVFSTTDQALVDQFVEVPSDDFTSDIYVYDRTTKKAQRLTKNKSSNSLFPEFTKDGDVIYVDHPHNPNSKVRFVIVNPN